MEMMRMVIACYVFVSFSGAGDDNRPDADGNGGGDVPEAGSPSDTRHS